MTYITVQYASNSHSQTMDIYEPAQIGDQAPLIMLIHGGAFKFGDARMPLIQPIITTALQHGYIVASIDYRKSDEAQFPGALADVKAAIRFLKNHAESYKIDPTKITVWGESAGGYLALMAALTPTVTELDGDIIAEAGAGSLPDVSALVAFYPPVEFYTMKAEYESFGDYAHGWGKFESEYLGVDDIYQAKTACDQAYWETYIDQLPVDFKLSAWIQVGDENDTKVPYLQSVNFAKRLAKVKGTQVQFHQIQGAKHEDLAFYQQENLTAILKFITQSGESE